MRPPDRSPDLVRFGWQIAESTLANAESERRLVTHWFLAPGDDSVNADDHFGSDERTLRFLGVALPTLIAQLGATAAVLALPWDLDGGFPSLTVVVVAIGSPTALQTRALTRLTTEPGPPFWRLEPGLLRDPPRLAAVATNLTF